MADLAEMKKIMEKEFGIKTEAQLIEAIKNTKKANFGVFLTPMDEFECEERGIA